MPTDSTTDDEKSRPGAWAPMRHALFRAIWIAQLFSNIGTWMQNVGAAWLMGDLAGTPMEIALVQTATSLPVLFVGLAAGALADIFDRRRLLLVTQAWMLAAATALAVLTAADVMTPATLLALTFALGLGAALNLPAWQAIQPELVPRRELGQAVALGAISMNVGRAVGPAVGGAVVALSGASAVFALNAISFIGVLVVLFWWRRPVEDEALPRERLASALRAGLRYARHSPSLRAVLVRAALFALPASALLALLPVVSRGPLGLGSGGFGILFACFGVGAVCAASVLPRIAEHGTDRVLLMASVLTALCLAVMAEVHHPVVVAFALLIGGAGWTSGFASFNVGTQSVLPAWVRARGMGLYVIVVQGGLAVGSAAWGAIAEVSLTASLLAAATAVVLTPLGVLRWRLTRTAALDLSPMAYWPEPVVDTAPDPDQGPVLITVHYAVRPECQSEFLDAMRKVQRVRRRTGARRWGLYRDSAEPTTYVETFLVESWEEHLRQHQRTTANDQQVQTAVLPFLVDGRPRLTSHLIWAY